MGLDDLAADLDETYADLGDDLAVELDEETRQELAMLATVTGPEDPAELVRRAVHMFFQTTVDTGKLDFHLRSGYDVTYDEYLSGMTYDEMAGPAYEGPGQSGGSDDRRYQF